MNPNHFLAVAIGYLFGGARPGWPETARIGKTLVSSLDDRPGRGRPRASRWSRCRSGFKWFVPGLIDGSFGFGGEESAGASFLRTDGSTWTTDKDGLILCLLASEILATTGKTPSAALRRAGRRSTATRRTRGSTPRPTAAQKAKLAALSPDDVTATSLAGEEITAQLTEAPGNGAQDRRPQGHHRVGLVRRPAVRHRGRLQDLRRVVPGPRAPRPGPGRGARGGLRGARLRRRGQVP